MHDPATFARIAQWVFDLPATYEKSERHALLALAAFINRETLEAWPSAGLLSRMTGMNGQVALRVLSRLAEHETPILQRLGQRKGGAVVWKVIHPGLIFAIDAAHGPGIHLTPGSQYQEEELKSHRGSVDPASILESSGTSLAEGWRQRIAFEMGDALAKSLVSRGLKQVTYVSDGVSPEWQAILVGLVDGAILQVEGDLPIRALVLVKAAEIAPDHIDFRHAGRSDPAPKILARNIGTVLGEARRRFASPPEEPKETAAKPPKADPRITEGIREQLRREHQQATAAIQEQVTARREQEQRKQAEERRSYRALRAQEAEENQEFNVEIERLLGEGS